MTIREEFRLHRVSLKTLEKDQYRLSEKGSSKPDCIPLFSMRNHLNFQSTALGSTKLFRPMNSCIHNLFNISLKSSSEIFKHCRSTRQHNILQSAQSIRNNKTTT